MEAETPLLENLGASFRWMSANNGSSTQTRQNFFPHQRDRSRDEIMLPQTIAHRGYKKKYPENTMSAFTAAVRVGCHAIETDMHLSRDGVVVISHDATLKRCFGIDRYIIDSDWEYLSSLRTIQEPHERMPRLADLLEYLASPGLEDIWLLLDIKLDNDSNLIMRRIAETIHAVPPGRRPWNERIVLGCWKDNYFPLCIELLPTFPVVLIAFNVCYARKFLKVPGISFNIAQKILMGPLGYRFLDRARAANKLVFVWTVNDPKLMRWWIRKGVDGVITDDPEEFKRIRDSWDGKKLLQGDDDRISFRQYVELVIIAVVVLLFGWIYRRRHRKRPPLPAVEGQSADSGLDAVFQKA